MAVHTIQQLQHTAGREDYMLSVSFRLLLWLYAVIPVCLLLQLLDHSFWGGYLQQALPTSPRGFLLFQILFGTPHIVASTILITTNKDYLNIYKAKILWMTLALALFFGIGSQFLSYRFLYILVASWTVYHVLKQQHGVARGICKLSGWRFYLQLWLSIAAGILVYLGIFLKNSLQPEQAEMIRQMSAVLCLVLVASTVLCQRSIASLFGKVFLWANTFLVLSSFYLYLQQYYFLAILVPRLVHDATAYIFYVTHDYNRHHVHPQNFIYRFANSLKINIFIVLPALSFALAYILQRYGDDYFYRIFDYLFGVEIHKAITLGLLGYLALMHYYTEAFAWKKGSPLRQYITFSK